MEDKTIDQPWDAAQKADWFRKQRKQRSYADDVLVRLRALDPDVFTLEQYGALSCAPQDYPLYAVKVGAWDKDKPVILITGGVHGYETSGVKGTLQFLEQDAQNYAQRFNIIAAPCISTWAYETVNRWNPGTDNPNREFTEDSTCEEAVFLMQYIRSLGVSVDYHIDCHETKDIDADIFGPEQDAKDGKPYDPSQHVIPDGFYLVTLANHPHPGLEAAIIKSVRTVTHIAPFSRPDTAGKITGEGELVRGDGIIAYPDNIGLCISFTGAAGRMGAVITEIYPDSPNVTEEMCNNGQVAAIKGGLDYLIREYKL